MPDFPDSAPDTQIEELPSSVSADGSVATRGANESFRLHLMDDAFADRGAASRGDEMSTSLPRSSPPDASERPSTHGGFDGHPSREGYAQQGFMRMEVDTTETAADPENQTVDEANVPASRISRILSAYGGLSCGDLSHRHPSCGGLNCGCPDCGGLTSDQAKCIALACCSTFWGTLLVSYGIAKAATGGC